MIIIKTWQQDVDCGANGGSVYCGVCETPEEVVDKEVLDSWKKWITEWEKTDYGYIRKYRSIPGYTLIWGEVILIQNGYKAEVELQHIDGY